MTYNTPKISIRFYSFHLYFSIYFHSKYQNSLLKDIEDEDLKQKRKESFRALSVIAVNVSQPRQKLRESRDADDEVEAGAHSI